MGFDTPAGTRVARQPSGIVVQWVNRRAASRLRRRGGGKFMGFSALVLTTVAACAEDSRHH
jgi:hypothetical protein